MGLSEIDKIRPNDGKPFSALPKDEQRAWEQAYREVRERYSEDIGAISQATADRVTARKEILLNQMRTSQPQSGRPAQPIGRSWERPDGGVEIDVGEGEPESNAGFGRETVENRERRLNRHYRDPSRLYGKDGTTLQGPDLAEYVDPTRKRYGDPMKFPDADRRQKNERQRLVDRHARGIPDHMPDAPMTAANGMPNLKFVKGRAPVNVGVAGEIPKGTVYGDPKTFPSRDSWRTPFRGGFSFNPPPKRD